jgi:hypothetical protein
MPFSTLKLSCVNAAAAARLAKFNSAVAVHRFLPDQDARCIRTAIMKTFLSLRQFTHLVTHSTSVTSFWPQSMLFFDAVSHVSIDCASHVFTSMI